MDPSGPAASESSHPTPRKSVQTISDDDDEVIPTVHIHRELNQTASQRLQPGRRDSVFCLILCEPLEDKLVDEAAV